MPFFYLLWPDGFALLPCCYCPQKDRKYLTKKTVVESCFWQGNVLQLWFFMLLLLFSMTEKS
jgi:hypothetical protein